MCREVGVDPGVVTRVTVDIAATLRCNSAQLDTNRMASVVEVLQSMAIAANTAELLPPAVDKSARQAEPEIGVQVALGALLRDCPSANHFERLAHSLRPL